MKRINYIVALFFAATLTLFAQETQPEATGNSLQDVLNRYGNSEIIEKAKAGANNLPTAECEMPEQEEIVIDHYFTISADGLKVKFSKGNLRYNIGTDTWSFAPKQYDYVGMSNINLGSPDYKGDIDLFGWSADGKFGVNPSNADADYAGSFVDWGLNMGNHWRTLTSDEWNYLIRTRRVNGQQAYTIASVNGMIGLVVLPDNWQLPAGITLELAYYPDTRVLESNVFTIAQWNQLEQAGAVFLPAVGTRVGGYGNTMNGDTQAAMSNPETGFYSWVSNVSEYGYYWSATPHATTAKSSYQMIWSPYYFNGSRAFPAMWSTEKRRGNAVRLVYDETYESQVKWTVRWVDYADTEVYSTTIDDPEESAEFAGTNPQCYTDAQFDYTFTGWSEAVADEELHTITYKAQYNKKECVYTVIFVWNPDLCKNKRSGFGNELLYSNSENTDTYTFKYGEQALLANTVGTEPKTIETDQALATCSFAFDGLTFGDNMKGLIKCGTTDNRYYYVFADITYQVKVKFNIGSTSQTTLNSCGEMPVMPTYTDASGTEKKFGIYQDLVNPIYVNGKLFKGWTPAITAVPCYPFESENPVVEYAANLVDVYTIKFIGADGRELESYSQVDVSVDGFAGVKLYEGDDPTKSATDAQTFSFSGWSEPSIDAENLTYTYTAQFNATARKYTITFKNRCTVSDATSANTTTSEYDAKQIDYGQTIIAPTDNPTCEGYQFDGWLLVGTDDTYLSADDKVTGTATYIATYKPLFTFCFYDEDGLNQLCCTEKQYLANTNPTDVYCLESIPSKPSTAQDTYSFSGWEKITEDELAHRISYKAVFVSTTNTYTITFKDAAGNNLSSQNIAYGGTIVAPDVNTPEGYDFAGWKVEGSDDVLTSLPTVSGNVTYVPAFTPIVYTVYYLGEGITDLTQAICSTTVTYQDKANPESCITDDSKPTKPSTAQYDYVLSWSRPIEDAEKRTIVYNAVFTPQTRKYSVVFADRTCVEADPTGAPTEAEQTVISKSELEYGASITVPAENPTCENHIFLGWKQLLNEETGEVAEDFYTGGATVSGNVTYLAQYTDRVTVRFYADQWSNVKAYQWKEIGENQSHEPLGSWGNEQQVLQSDADGWYSVSCPISYNIVFYTNNGAQTINIENITKDTCFELGTLNTEGDNRGKYEVDNLYQCTHSVYKLVGTENIFGVNWNNGGQLDDIRNMTRHVHEDGTVEYRDTIKDIKLEATLTNMPYKFKVLNARYELNEDGDLTWKELAWYPLLANPIDINNPDNNVIIEVPQSGTYTIYFSYVVNSGEPTYKLRSDADVYVVAGAMFENEWAPEDTDNQMTRQADGTYKLVVTGIQLTTSNNQYQIVRNGNEWIPDGAYNNKVVEIEEDGLYDITFTYNPQTEDINAVATRKELERVEVEISGMEVLYIGDVDQTTESESEWWGIDMRAADNNKNISDVLVVINSKDKYAVSGSYNSGNGTIDIDLENNSTSVVINGQYKPATAATLTLNFMGYDETYLELGYKFAKYSGSFSLTTEDAIYYGEFGETTSSAYPISEWGSPNHGIIELVNETYVGVFSVSEDKTVKFAPGNLVYDEEQKTYSFAGSQLEYGSYLSYIGQSGSMVSGLTFTKLTAENDWGANQIGDVPVGTYRTLSLEEWNYVVNREGKAMLATIFIDDDATVKGLLLLPDNWEQPEDLDVELIFSMDQYIRNMIPSEEWAKMQKAGAVFLPAAGRLSGLNANEDEVQTSCFYWCSNLITVREKEVPTQFYVYENVVTNSSLTANAAVMSKCPVRLVADNQSVTPPQRWISNCCIQRRIHRS